MPRREAHRRSVQLVIRLPCDKNVGDRQRRRHQHHIGVDPPAAGLFKQRIAEMIGMKRRAWPVELMSIERDITIENFARIATRHARRQAGDRAFAVQLDCNAPGHEARQTQRFIGRKRAMPEAAHDPVRPGI
jgi:hypothetical protein